MEMITEEEIIDVKIMVEMITEVGAWHQEEMVTEDIIAQMQI